MPSIVRRSILILGLLIVVASIGHADTARTPVSGQMEIDGGTLHYDMQIWNVVSLYARTLANMGVVSDKPALVLWGKKIGYFPQSVWQHLELARE